jgi:hypothetical protein
MSACDTKDKHWHAVVVRCGLWLALTMAGLYAVCKAELLGTLPPVVTANVVLQSRNTARSMLGIDAQSYTVTVTRVTDG